MMCPGDDGLKGTVRPHQSQLVRDSVAKCPDIIVGNFELVRNVPEESAKHQFVTPTPRYTPHLIPTEGFS